MMRHHYRDTAEHDRLHGIQLEPEGPLMEQCPKHGPWGPATHSFNECPACYRRREELADIEAAEWQRPNPDPDELPDGDDDE